jgi:hypothetical protein
MLISSATGRNSKPASFTTLTRRADRAGSFRRARPEVRSEAFQRAVETDSTPTSFSGGLEMYLGSGDHDGRD